MADSMQWSKSWNHKRELAKKSKKMLFSILSANESYETFVQKNGRRTVFILLRTLSILFIALT